MPWQPDFWLLCGNERYCLADDRLRLI